MGQDFFTYLLASAAFALFIVCPRMAAMTDICHRHVMCNLVVLVILGTLASIPLLIMMVYILRGWGFAAAIGFAIATDLLSALLMGVFSRKATIEIIIISLFVISGSRLATWITTKLSI